MSSQDAPKKYDKERKIQSIFRAMTRLIAARDFNTISIRDIARDADVSIGTIYLYFPEGKENIVHEMINRKIAQIAPTSLITSGEIHTLRDLVWDIIANYYDFHVQNKQFLMAFERASLNRPDLYQDINHNIDFGLEQVLKDLQAQPQTRLLPEMLVASPEVQGKMSQVLKVIDGIIHRDVLFSPIFESREEAIGFLLTLFVKLLNIPLDD